MKRYFIKYVSIMISILFISNAIVFAEVPKDVQETKYEEAVSVLLSLGLINNTDDGSFQPDETVTRAEFASIIAKVLGLEDQTAANADEDSETDDESTEKMSEDFVDVPADHWALNDIIAVTRRGIIDGSGYRKFSPDNIVTYEQAVKIIICALGYKLDAEQKGGFPTGYITTAVEKGVLKNCEGKFSAPASRGIIAQMLYNALDVDIMQQTKYGDKTGYTIEKRKTLLSKLDIETEDAIVNATGDTRLDGESGIGNDEVEINDVRFKVGQTKAKDLLGYRVTYYAKKEKDQEVGVLLYIVPQKGQNEVLRVNADDVNGNDEEFSKTNFVYTVRAEGKADERKEARISSTPNVIYNGKAFTAFSSASIDKLKPVSGSVTLIDNDNDGKYDIIFVENNYNIVLNKVSPSNNTISDKYDVNKTLTLDSDSNSIKYTITKEGESLGLQDLQEWDVLTVTADLDETIYKIVVTNEIVEGKVTEKTTVGELKYIINDKEYKVAENYKNAIASGSSKAASIEIDSEGIFYLDAEGKIAATDIKNIGDRYGYLMKAAIKKGVDPTYKLKLLTTEGEKISYSLAKKITLKNAKVRDVNGDVALLEYKRINDKQITDCRDLFDEDKKVIPQLINYELNENDEITSIKIADTSIPDTKSGIYFDKQNVFSMDYHKLSTDPSIYYRSNGSIRYFAGEYSVNDKTRLLLVPEVIDDSTAEDEFAMGSLNSFGADQEIRQDIAFYDVDMNGYCKVIVMKAPAEAPNIGDTSITVVDRITNAVDENGESVYKIYGYKAGKKVSLILPFDENKLNKLHETQDGWGHKAFPINKLSKGDVINYSVGNNGMVDSVRIIFIAKDVGPNIYEKGDFITGGSYASNWIEGENGGGGAGNLNQGDTYEKLYVGFGKVNIVNSESFYFQVNGIIDASHNITSYSSVKGRKVMIESTTVAYIYDYSKDMLKLASPQDVNHGDYVCVAENFGHTTAILIIKK